MLTKMGFQNQNEVKEVLEQNKNPTRATKQLPLAKKTKLKVNFHTEKALTDERLMELATEFYSFVSEILTNEKLDTFNVYFRYPIYTNSLSDEIFKRLAKVFDGRNPVYHYDFGSPSQKEDWVNYRNKVLDLNRWWRNEAMKSMATRHNSIVVADLPMEQKTDRPEPYLYFVPIEKVLQLDTEDFINLKWVAFAIKDKTYVYDDEYYRVFQNDDRGMLGEMLVESRHELGYCPARMFWEDSINERDRLVKEHLFYAWVSRLDMALVFDLFGEDLNSYSRYPVASSYDINCDFQDEEVGVACKNGWLYRGSSPYMQNRKPVGCPQCSKKRFNGPGSIISVSPPSPANDQADQSNPFKYADIPVTSLEFNKEDIRDRYKKIFEVLTGFVGMPINDQAVNADQVAAIMDSLEAALIVPQRNLESVMNWAESTLCRLRYTSFESASISLGTDHFVLNSSQLLELYCMAKEKGASPNILDQQQDRYFDSEYRNNPEMKQRQEVFNLLDPFRHLTVPEVKDMYAQGQIPFELFMLKVNMSTFVSRFESEVFPITSFEKGVSLANRVNVIKAKINEYISEMTPEPQPDEDPANVGE